jgi:hypothetical protein
VLVHSLPGSVSEATAVVNNLAALGNVLVLMVSGSGGVGQPGWQLVVNSIGDSVQRRGFSQ